MSEKEPKDYVDESDEPMIDAITRKLQERIKARREERDGKGEGDATTSNSNIRGGNSGNGFSD